MLTWRLGARRVALPVLAVMLVAMGIISIAFADRHREALTTGDPFQPSARLARRQLTNVSSAATTW